jgi:hypothetical protein
MRWQLAHTTSHLLTSASILSVLWVKTKAETFTCFAAMWSKSITYQGKTLPQSEHGCDFSALMISLFRSFRRRRRAETWPRWRCRFASSLYQARQATF